ncbi:hypothetical protein BBF96_02855 [Anoxybacter fermentans]|uniref:Uncharacterized protein n=1 Tax=Anoxybacter fermentans TaxID=1323375 RepID=A0A3S9SVU1_9FIRM|nr:hypothetical protein [Anoxybacter fermentans]AZR72426.1 hypothetical protein BBF96_02855 [Anoxybacter fermentans]
MATCAYYILGNSDLKVIDMDGNEISKVDNFREYTRELADILKNTNSTAKKDFLKFDKEVEIKFQNKGEKNILKISKIRMPIFTAYIDKINQTQHKKPDKIIFFYTNQENPDKGDTIYLYQIIRLFAQKRYRYNESDICGIEVSCNPSNYEEVGRFYDEYFEKNEEQIKYNSMNYILSTTGTPAMTNILSVKMLDYPHQYYYGERADNGGTRIIELNYFTKLNCDRYRRLIDRTIKDLCYNNASEIFKESPFRKKFEVRQLLKVAYHLRNFNFENAYEEAEILEQNKWLLDRVSDLQLKTEERLSLIYDFMEISLENHKYLETVALLFGLLDNLRQYLFEKTFRIKIKDEKTNSFSEFNNFIESKPDLKSYFDKKGIKYKNAPTKVVLNKILSDFLKYGDKKTPEDRRNSNYIERFFQLNEKVEHLQDLRNMTPFAHGVKGIILEDICNLKNTISDILEFLKLIDIKKENDDKKNNKKDDKKDEDNIFKKINNAIIELLEKY